MGQSCDCGNTCTVCDVSTIVKDMQIYFNRPHLIKGEKMEHDFIKLTSRL